MSFGTFYYHKNNFISCNGFLFAFNLAGITKVQFPVIKSCPVLRIFFQEAASASTISMQIKVIEAMVHFTKK